MDTSKRHRKMDQIPKTSSRTASCCCFSNVFSPSSRSCCLRGERDSHLSPDILDADADADADSDADACSSTSTVVLMYLTATDRNSVCADDQPQPDSNSM